MAAPDAPPPDLDALTAAGVELERWAELVDDDRWGGPTPCADWTIGDLVDHVVGGNVFTVEVLAGRSADAALAAAMATFDERYERRAALASTLEAQRSAFAAPDALTGSFGHVNGRLGGESILHARIHDLIVHGWDLATSVAPPAELADQLARWAVAELGAPGSLTAEHFGIEPAAVHDGRSLLAAFGRLP